MIGKVLVTGGAGFIGSHLVEALVGRGASVRVLDDLSLGQREWVHPQAEFIQGDIRNLDTCIKATAGCEGVFHMAAMSRSAASIDAIEHCTSANVLGTQNVLAAARGEGVRKVVYSGSSTYYGNRPAPHYEALPGDFLNMYGLSKYVGEEYCLMFDRLYGVPALVLRYFNVYGPRQPEEGVYALVLGIFLRRAAAGKPLIIHGSGDQRRDFVHVRDVAAANIAAFESDAHGTQLNVGSGESISVKELADMISPLQEYTARRPADAEVTLADLTRIRSLIGWEPRVSFAEGLRELRELIAA
ncbi:MAG TPA: NAD-dependent epimerase/dehydratase family protein [Bryobacteraceae bacterium]|nr:NAD-dependent epimerase/dehydratase family protein [Bryobacteraceae bacterium]